MDNQQSINTWRLHIKAHLKSVEIFVIKNLHQVKNDPLLSTHRILKWLKAQAEIIQKVLMIVRSKYYNTSSIRLSQS